jgi:hypothetical protein
MTELNERIRELIDGGVEPVSAEEIFRAHDLLKKGNRVGHTRPRRRRRILVVSGVAVLAVALVGVGVGLVSVPGAKNAGVPRASAATFLKLVATKAADEPKLVPGAGEYLYVAQMTSMTNGARMSPSPRAFWYDANELVQTWTSPELVGHKTWQVVGRPEFLSDADRATWVTDGSKPLGSGSSSGGLATYYNVAGLPATASAMTTYFRSQKDLPTESSYGSWPSWEFDVALGFLQNGASSVQRAALLKYIATLRGVRLLGQATSIVTREKGSVIAMPLVRRGWTEEAIFDASTSNLIETRLVITGTTSKTVQIGFPTPFIGEIESYTDFLFAGITRVNSNYSRPSGVPIYPTVWPFSVDRQPLPGWLNSPIERRVHPHSG